MAIQCTSVDTHLANSINGVNFTLSTSSFSVAVWINADWTTASGTNGSFVGLYGPAPTPTTAIQIGRRSINDGVTVWTWGGAILVQTTAGALTSNTWNHVAYTYDGTTHNLYINGTLAATSTTAQLAGQLTTVYINGYPTGTTSEVSTYKVDSYLYYNRTLSVDEVKTIYAAKGARHCIVNGLLAMYEFDEGIEGATTTSIIDLSGNGNTLSISGAVSTGITYTYVGATASSNLRRVH